MGQNGALPARARERLEPMITATTVSSGEPRVKVRAPATRIMPRPITKTISPRTPICHQVMVFLSAPMMVCIAS